MLYNRGAPLKQFMAFCHSDVCCLQRPTLLAKIFGLYTIEYRHISTEKRGDAYVINGRKSGSTVRINLMVMENLFYGRRFSKVRLCA